MRVVLAALTLVFAVVFGVMLLPNIGDELHRIRADETSGSLNCSTGVGESECDVTLPSAHFFAGGEFLTVTETSPGSGVRTATLAADQTTVTVSGLSAETAYTFAVAYEVANPNLSNASGADDLLRVFPFLFVIGVVVIGVVMALGSFRV